MVKMEPRFKLDQPWPYRVPTRKGNSIIIRHYDAIDISNSIIFKYRTGGDIFLPENPIHEPSILWSIMQAQVK